MDVKSVFLNGELDEDIYMEQPQGFIIFGSESLVCRLKKAIYGLKQASCTWNLQLHGVLTGLGFKQTYANAGVYVKSQQEGDAPLFVIVYVKDITILGVPLDTIKCLKSDLFECFEMTNLGKIKSYLGMHITCNHSLSV
jgi:ATP-binding cassette subfamily B (MDR/TAP) protein 1